MFEEFIRKLCQCLFPPKAPEIDEEMYKRILEFKNDRNEGFLYGNLR